MVSPRDTRGALAALLLAVLLAARPAASGEIGAQRVGTSSGTFLKIGIGARPVAMGRAASPILGDPTSLFNNPAGLAYLERPTFIVERVSWLADVDMTAAGIAAAIPWGGVAGLSALSLGSDMEETTELEPDGTGRSFSHRDLAFGLSYGRHLTDRFSFGVTGRYVYEALGTEIGGPSTSTWLIDMGTTFDTGFHGVVLAMSITSFGPDLNPGGSYSDPRPGRGNEVEFAGFAPPTTFALASSYQAFTLPEAALYVSGEFVRPADNDETVRVGGELELYDTLALRGGYDGASDALPWSGGIGVRFGGERLATHIDYAFSSSEYFDRVDRVTLRFAF
jgi:hypothetical protein